MGGQRGCERRSEVFSINSKRKSEGLGGGLGGGQGGCERRIEVCVKIKKKIGWGRVGSGSGGRWGSGWM